VDRIYPTGLLLLVVAAVKVVQAVMQVQEEDCRAIQLKVQLVLVVEPKLLVVLRNIFVVDGRWFIVQEVMWGCSV
jgi:hypothetical protein